MSTHDIDHAFEGCLRLPISNRSKLVIMSDCHRGIGDAADNFAGNENLYFNALTRYYDAGFTYIELGDGDELWENTRFDMIKRQYDHIFWLLQKYYHSERLYMLYGNHDFVKSRPRWREKNFACYVDDNGRRLPLFHRMTVHEGLVLSHHESGAQLYLLHGHQADFFNDKLWKVGRFLVRHLWRPLEMLGIKNPGDTPLKDGMEKVEVQLTRWAAEHGVALVAGHTHRPVFPEAGKPAYYNDGSCVHPRCITALEIENGAISLIKWSVLTRHDGTLYIGKTLLEGPRTLSAAT